MDSVGAKFAIERDGLQQIIAALASRGYRVIGPTVRDGAIIYDSVVALDDLPAGWTDQQEAGHYRLERRADAALFGYAVGPHSWKRFLHPPIARLWQAKRDENGFSIVEHREIVEPFAFIGVRACELRAIAIHDRVFLDGEYADEAYRMRRDHAFIVAVNCGQAGGTCFCVSMDAGPKAEIADAERIVAQTKDQMGRSLVTDGLKELLQANPNHSRWDEVAERCLTCGNCTNVCPTCFCTTIDDATDLSGNTAERVRRWDSCFTLDFSYIHGGNVRSSARSHYRQWMTHKLAHWVDQFGSSGCVGCGRCITWCPVGIDITEEAAAIRTSPET